MTQEARQARAYPWMVVLTVALLVACNRNDSKMPAASGSSKPAEPPSQLVDNADSAETATSKTETAADPVPETSEGTSKPAELAAHSTPPAAQTDKSAETHTASKSEYVEPIFQDWPAPKFALLITGQQMGYLEPCGCTGLANQKGGLARRHTLAKEIAQRGWPVVGLDVGNQVRSFGRQSEIKFQVTAEALKKIGYQAIALGVDDLRLSSGELAAVTWANDGGSTPFLSANAAVVDRALTPTHTIIEIGGKKIGVTAVLGRELQSKIIGADVVMTSPEEGLDAVMPQLKEAKCDALILLAHASIQESQQLAQKYPDFSIVITAGGIGDPTFQPEPINGTKAVMVQVGLKGMFAGVLGFYEDEKTPWRYQRVPLDKRFEDSPDMLAILAAYQEQLKTLGFDNLGLKPLPHPSGHSFVGSEKCGECHSTAFAIWKDTPHAHATESLVHPPERSEVPRHFDPECLSCHVTGWNPQKFFPYTSGYLSLDATPLMTNSGCENCHGPGSGHVAAESGEGNPTKEMIQQLRQSMRLPLASAEKKCIECHDIDNSPDFHDRGAFEKYWKRVEHKGVE